MNQCVGAKNYRYFLLFITMHMILTTYAFILGVFILYYYIELNNLHKARFMYNLYKISNKTTEEVIEATNWTVYKFVIARNYAFFSSLVLLVSISITLFFFYYTIVH